MKKAVNQINATGIFINLARMLDNSHNEVLGLYDETFANLPFDGKSHTRKLTSPAMVQQVQDHIQQLGKFLKTTPMETMIFVAIYAYQVSHGSQADCRDITRFFNISELDFLPLKSSISSLEEKGVIRTASQRHGGEYRITGAAENALMTNKTFEKRNVPKMDRYAFCAGISSLIEMRSNGDIDTTELFSLVETEETRNGHLKMVKNLPKILTDIENRTFFYEICDDFIHDRNRHTGVEVTLNDIYESVRSRLNNAKAIMDQTHPLISEGLAELLPSKFFNDAEICLTEKGKQLFLEEDYDLLCSNKGLSDKRLITPDKIPARELFFNAGLTKEIDFVKESLMDDHFEKLQERMSEHSLPKGVAMLFHGLPGTGKTAAANMLAKATGRSIYHVDIAASKSFWFGESEKLFKKIFVDYRKMCETEERKPILLFNEADALFSRRKDVEAGNCAQTENALQNILLEELETLDGILIATTNLSANLDSAFDRRFLFKISFGKPDTEAKKSIWKNKLSWLSDEETQRLAERHDLSGGEIDNIVRKTLMEEVLHGERPNFTTLDSWCKNEKINQSKCGTIGFTK